jgi:hypothetical protein
LTFKTTETIGISRILIHNNLGQLVKNEKVAGKNLSIDMSNLAQGIYFVTLASDHGNVVKKIIKE